MRIIGADVSHWEGNITWTEAVKFLPFVYYKATDGEDFIDSQLGNNHDGCDEVGIPNAPYHWWQELEDPIIQANHFCDTLEDVGDDYKKEIVDVEPKQIADSAKLKALLDRIEYRRGRKPAIYTSAYYWNTFVRPLPGWTNQYDLLCAHYKYGLNPTLPIGWTMDRLKVWQFSDKFWFHGCAEIADGNWFYGDLQQCRDWFGNYHPYNDQPPIPGTKTLMRVTAGTLNIRSAPLAPGGQIIGQLHQGDVIEVLDVAGQDAWIRHEKGWSCCKVGNYIYLVPS